MRKMIEMPRDWKRRERKINGRNWDELEWALVQLSELKDDTLFTDSERDALVMAMDCTVQILNRMLDGKRIQWD